MIDDLIIDSTIAAAMHWINIEINAPLI